MGLIFQSTGQILIIFAIIALGPPTSVGKPWGEIPNQANTFIWEKKALLEVVAERRIPKNSNGK